MNDIALERDNGEKAQKAEVTLAEIDWIQRYEQATHSLASNGYTKHFVHRHVVQKLFSPIFFWSKKLVAQKNLE